MKAITTKIDADIPEQASITFETNGTQGGDSGHGGYAVLTIHQEGGDFAVKVDGEEIPDAMIQPEKVEIRVGGDWEITGMVSALIELGRQLQAACGDMPNNIPAPGFLRRAAEIMEERGKQYDKPEGERSMGKCVEAFNIVTGRDLTEAEGWLLLQILKDVRQWQRPGFHLDSAEDCIAYAALKAEALQKEGADAA